MPKEDRQPTHTQTPDQQVDFRQQQGGDRASGTWRFHAVALLVIGCNPVYDAPADLNFAAAMGRVGETIHLGFHVDETATASRWHLPRSHYLEAWGIAISGDAAAQIDANGYSESVPLVYWRTPEDRYVRTVMPSADTANALPLDGVTGW